MMSCQSNTLATSLPVLNGRYKADAALFPAGVFLTLLHGWWRLGLLLCIQSHEYWLAAHTARQLRVELGQLTGEQREIALRHLRFGCRLGRMNTMFVDVVYEG